MIWLLLLPALAADALPPLNTDGVVEVAAIEGAWTERIPTARPPLEYVEGTEAKHDAWWFDLATGEGRYDPMRLPEGWIHWAAVTPDDWSWTAPVDRVTRFPTRRSQARLAWSTGSLTIQRAEDLILRLDGKEPVTQKIPPSMDKTIYDPRIGTLAINPTRTEALVDERLLLDLRTGHFDLPVPTLDEMAFDGGRISADATDAQTAAARYGCHPQPVWPTELGQLSPDCTTQLVDQRVQSLLDGTVLRELPESVRIFRKDDNDAPEALSRWQDGDDWITWVFGDGTWVSIATDGRAVGNERTGAVGWRDDKQFTPVLPVAPLPAQPEPADGLVQVLARPGSKWAQLLWLGMILVLVSAWRVWSLRR